MQPNSPIYKAQTVGNIEPIEYMIPYPSTQAIIEGQIIKYKNEKVFKDYGLTNIDFFNSIQRTSNWLNDQGVLPKDKVVINDNSFLNSILLLYGLWHIGAIAVFLEKENYSPKNKLNAKCLDYSGDLIKVTESHSSHFIPKYKPLLNDHAVVVVSNDKTVFLSHYGLLVNANGLQKLLNLKQQQSFFCDIKPKTSFWVVICAILPIYAMAIFTSKSPSILLTYDNIDIEDGFKLREDWVNIDNYKVNELSLCKENSAILTLKNNPIHLTDYKIIEDELWLKGHSLMNRYFEKDKMVFKDDYLIIKEE
ncbi:hypothetical protein OA864_00640 [bacterium]|nr:hypothetical protein [bacterium]MDC3158843.1 hypothetical protein [bacterium]